MCIYLNIYRYMYNLFLCSYVMYFISSILRHNLFTFISLLLFFIRISPVVYYLNINIYRNIYVLFAILLSHPTLMMINVMSKN